jgi:hypothetical protein
MVAIIIYVLVILVWFYIEFRKATLIDKDGNIIKESKNKYPMNHLLEWITDNGYVYRTVNKTKVWYKSSQYPRVFLENEQLIELYNQNK